MMETYIADFHKILYIPEIQKLEFHLPRVRILSAYHCCNTRQEAFKRCSTKKDVLYNRDYDDGVVSSFAHQMQYEYYGNNISVSIEGIVLEHFISTTHTETEGTLQKCTLHAMFHSFFLMKAKNMWTQLLHTENE